MHHHRTLNALGNLLAVVVIVVVIVYGLESCGWHTGMPELLVCRVGKPLVTGTLRELMPWGIALGVLLLILQISRGAGITLLALSIGALALVDLWQQQTVTFCGGSFPGQRFKP